MNKYPNLFLILIIFHVSSFTDRVRSETLRQLSKRSENDFQMCLDNFDIHTDKIIRTQDSKAMGAKYINEIDVASREDCLRVCCETDNCDVFVFEEKSPGSCYLFECGSPEDFKCKFTRHKNYTSAVLAVNRHLTDLESQIKITQHEHELTKLREPIGPVEPATKKTTTQPPETKEAVQLIPAQSPLTNTTCSRFQFACHTKGECIAIYNACDGIPQCSDGSDEAPELGCPAIPTTTTTQRPVTYPPVVISKPGPKDPTNIAPPPAPYQGNQRQWNQQQYMNHYPESENVQGPVPQSPNPEITPNMNYGREGEGLAYRNGQNMWQYHQNGGSQIFAHKGNGLVPQHPYKPTEQQGYGDQTNYNYDANYRNYPQSNPAWQHRPQNVEGQEGMDEGVMSRNPEMGHGMVPPDYFYEDTYRNRPQQVGQHRFSYQHGPQVPQDPNQPPAFQPPRKMEVEPPQRPPETKKPTTLPPVVTHPPETPTTTQKPKVPEIHHPTEHKSHRKIEKLTAEVSLRETKMGDMYEANVNPSGAILSLTFGLLITGIMVVLVGCRMRMVHRRMRRGGKSPYAHDADFLVNGMYL